MTSGYKAYNGSLDLNFAQHVFSTGLRPRVNKQEPETVPDAETSLAVDINEGQGSFLSALSVVSQNKSKFFSKQYSTRIDEVPILHVLYPGNIWETYPLICPLRDDDFDPLSDIAHMVRCVAYDFKAEFGDPGDSLGNGIYHKIARSVKKGNFDVLESELNNFNNAMKLIVNHEPERIASLRRIPLSYKQSEILLEQVYSRVIPDPETLQSYKGFSREVYGETRPSTITDLIRITNIKQQHTFLDLGSGIGNVVLQIHAQTGCKAYGIELLEIPANYAKLQLNEFKARLGMYGREAGEVVVWKGDFTNNDRVHAIISIADVVFVNNYVFEADLNHKLADIFHDCKDGAQIVSFSPFKSLDRATSRYVSDDLPIKSVQKVAYKAGGVSWTSSPGEYYIHLIDRRRD
eukprot:Partr_v1_DN28048_c3_g1_i2_m56702 putative Histone methyltransferase that specifically methylates histone H3 to form H3K79me. This methylation is required for telomere silencing and for the pachytene checkpoint during the meiotic cell cycle by allowing the recruitment of RAD9 to double strand breaks. Nucleosomes are preferred as substrate compared to free histones (By similarity)